MTGILDHSAFMAMGTRFDIVVPSNAQLRADTLAAMLADQVERFEQSLSTYREGSAVCHLNAQLVQGVRAVVDDPDLFDALQKARALSRLTFGLFDVARRDGDTSTTFEIDDVNWVVEATEPGMSFDFGGLGKGLALDHAASVLADAQITDALLSFGESSVLARGHHPHADHWPVAVRDPVSGGRLCVQELMDTTLTTSSTVGNGRGEGRNIGHIVDPASGTAIADACTTTVTGLTATQGEAVSTAMVVGGAAGIEGLKAAFPGAEMHYFALPTPDISQSSNMTNSAVKRTRFAHAD